MLWVRGLGSWPLVSARVGGGGDPCLGFPVSATRSLYPDHWAGAVLGVVLA